jgi:thioredoxin reductase (NADPH)
MTGDGHSSSIELINNKTGETRTLATPALFSFIGAGATRGMASRAGVFAAGDVRSGSVKRVASAVCEGAMATAFVHEYLRKG